MKVHLRTFGCRANHYDSEVVRGLVLRAGHVLVDTPTDADVAVFNSCAVTGEAERDVRKAVRRAARENPRLRSIVMGCASALEASRPVLRALPTVQDVVAGADIARVASLLGIVDSTASREAQSSVRAVLRVQDGCDEHCTFCATTLARGANRSRQAAELVDEALALAEHHPEIVITGTHIGTYGADIDSSLGALMQRLVRDVPRVRFRLSSIEATEVDESLAELLTGDAARVAPHLHAPLQSGSDRVLKRMGRHWYTAESYARAIERLTRGRPVFGLGADVIVGFPGETAADFQATLDLVERLPFTYLHVFTYSPRAGTAATRLRDHVSLGDTQARSAELRHRGQAKGNDYRRRRVGTAADAIVITAGEPREAITEDYLTLPVRGLLPRGERFRAMIQANAETVELHCHPEQSEGSAVTLRSFHADAHRDDIRDV